MIENIGENFKWWVGVVEDRNDPLKLGRCRVRVYGEHTKVQSEIPTNSLPWAQPLQSIQSAAMGDIGYSPTGLVEGTWVVGFWLDGKDMQRPIILGSLAGMPYYHGNPDEGFNDPNQTTRDKMQDFRPTDSGTIETQSVYPSRIDEPDVNRLARNDGTITRKNDDGSEEDIDYNHSVPTTKDNNAKLNVSTAFGASWSEPLSYNTIAGVKRYNTTYPKNHVHESESGHIKEIDDSKGAERIHEYHKTGTFYEIDAGGNKVVKVVANNYTLVAGNDYVHVAGEVDITSDSTIRLKAPNVKIETDNYDIRAGRYTVDVTGETHFTHTGTRWEYIGGDTHTVKESGKVDYTCPTIRTGEEDCTKPENAS